MPANQPVCVCVCVCKRKSRTWITCSPNSYGLSALSCLFSGSVEDYGTEEGWWQTILLKICASVRQYGECVRRVTSTGPSGSAGCGHRSTSRRVWINSEPPLRRDTHTHTLHTHTLHTRVACLRDAQGKGTATNTVSVREASDAGGLRRCWHGSL